MDVIATNAPFAWVDLFKMKIAVAVLLFITDLIFGVVPVFVPIRYEKFTRVVSWINCFSGGFLLGSTLLQMLYEADRMLEQSLGDFPSAFMMFGLGYVFVMFFEKWIKVITTEYQSIHNGNSDEPGSWILRSRADLVRSNNITAYMLAASCIIENFISAFAVGTQIDAGSLWTMAVMLLSTEWIQMFMFVFQFQRCKYGMLSELLHKHESPLLIGPQLDTMRKSVRGITFINVVVISATNSLGIFMGNVFSQMALSSNRNVQTTCAGILLAFVAGIFMHLATSQMIIPEFESGVESERVLLIKAGLIVAGIIVSSLMNVLVMMYL